MSLAASKIITIAIASSILVLGLIDDLRSRKVHNKLFLFCCGLGIICSLITGGATGIIQGFMGFGAALALLLPLVLLKALGAGDMKILAAFGLATNWEAVTYVAGLSIIWGALFGVVRIIIKGQLQTFIANIFKILTRQNPDVQQLHTIPYTAALLFGWMTYLTLKGGAA